MPSRQLPPPSQPPPPPPPLAAVSLLLLLTLCFPRRRRTAPSLSPSTKPSPSLIHFPYSVLRAATASFSGSNLLGRGGFGSVYRGVLKDPTRHVAVKAMDTCSLQGEREFRNELMFGPITAASDKILHVIGFSTGTTKPLPLFSTSRKQRPMLLVYDLMPRGSLQDCLLQHKPPKIKIWKIRFRIILDVARGLEFLHYGCENVIVHGDIKPSNVLLDDEFRARIGDFGLARMKTDEGECRITVMDSGTEGRKDVDDTETESVTTVGVDEFLGPSQSPEMSRDPETVVTDKGSLSEGNFERASIESGRRTGKSRSGKDWWWKQENSGKEGVVKDYVMEWIGNEIKKEKPKNDFTKGSSSSLVAKSERKSKRREKRRLDWWMAMDDEKDKKRDKRRPAREWWKEEFCEELAKKKKKMKKRGPGSVSDGYNSENLRPIDDDMYLDRSKKKKKGSSSKGYSHDSDSVASSTPSMRGTVCYVAPEYGLGDDLSEKCDVYSFGVLMLVVIAGRRPLQVTGSPISEFQRANLLSWSRHLARVGKLLDLVDKGLESVDQEQAMLYITIALLCIQKSPSKRPSMREVVGMLTGELKYPSLPVEFSPSPPFRFPYKLKKGPVSF